MCSDPEAIVEQCLRERKPGGYPDDELDGLCASWGWHTIEDMERRKAENAAMMAGLARRDKEAAEAGKAKRAVKVEDEAAQPPTA